MNDAQAFFDFLRQRVNAGASDELIRDMLRQYERVQAQEAIAEYAGFMDGQGPPEGDWSRRVELSDYMDGDYVAPDPQSGADMEHKG